MKTAGSGDGAMDGTRDADADTGHRHLLGTRNRTAKSGRHITDHHSNNISDPMMKALFTLGVNLHKDQGIQISK